MPEREDDHLTPATRLLEKRREMAEVEQALAAQKEVGFCTGFISMSYSLCAGLFTWYKFVSSTNWQLKGLCI